LGIASWIVLGFLAGLFAGAVTGARQARGCLPRIVVGVLGALVGGALARAAGVGTVTGLDLRSMAIATVGAVLLLFVLDAVERR
jgi:uncharacterized membrane protein YeaQ/YmgE (transglycosylase-associated protein family)